MSSSPTTLRSSMSELLNTNCDYVSNCANFCVSLDAMAGRSGIEKGRLSVSRGGRSSYKGATFWANAIPYEVKLNCEDTNFLTELTKVVPSGR